MVVWCFQSWTFAGDFTRELHADSRENTTFITHEGLFRYKRLSFRVNAVLKKHQHVLRQAIAGREGVVNVTDDLICCCCLRARPGIAQVIGQVGREKSDFEQ